MAILHVTETHEVDVFEDGWKSFIVQLEIIFGNNNFHGNCNETENTIKHTLGHFCWVCLIVGWFLLSGILTDWDSVCSFVLLLFLNMY